MKFDRSINSIVKSCAAFEVIFIDVWGVLHNGEALFDKAVKFLEILKQQNKTVILITNSPKRAQDLEAFLEKLGLDRDLFSSVITSGELLYQDLLHRDENHFHAIRNTLSVIDTEEKNAFFFHSLNLNIHHDYTASKNLLLYRVDGLSENEFNALYDYVLTERPLLICANADKYVIHNGKRRRRPGLIAFDYAHTGGEVYIYGKPDRRIFNAAYETLGNIAKDKIAMIGDNIDTDIKGAMDFGIEAILLSHESSYGDNPGTIVYQPL